MNFFLNQTLLMIVVYRKECGKCSSCDL